MVNEISTIGIDKYIALSAIIFSIGAIGLLTRKNLLIMLMSVELMLNAVNLSFISFSKYLGNLEGQVIVLFVMTIAAAEVGVGLAIVISIYNKVKKIDLNLFDTLKG